MGMVFDSPFFRSCDDPGSFSGRTSAFEAAYQGSNPWPGTVISRVGTGWLPLRSLIQSVFVFDSRPTHRARNFSSRFSRFYAMFFGSSGRLAGPSMTGIMSPPGSTKKSSDG